MSFVEVVNSMWRLDVPKALSDVVEALLGAVLIDSCYDYEVTREVVLRLLKEPLEYVHPRMGDDSLHEFLKWVGIFGCGQVQFRLVIFVILVGYLITSPSPNRKASSPGEEDPDAPKDLIYDVVHGIDIKPPVSIAYKTSIMGTRAEAAHKAHLLLQGARGGTLGASLVRGSSRRRRNLRRQLEEEEEAEVEALILEQEVDAGAGASDRDNFERLSESY